MLRSLSERFGEGDVKKKDGCAAVSCRGVFVNRIQNMKGGGYRVGVVNSRQWEWGIKSDGCPMSIKGRDHV